MNLSATSKQDCENGSASNGKCVLRIEGLSKTFNLHEQDKTIHAFNEVSFSAYTGSLTALTGPSGAGKSSILSCIYRSYLTTSGCIQYTDTDGDKHDLSGCDEHTILKLRRDEIRFVTQFLHFLPRQSTLNVVAWPLIQQGSDTKEAHEQAAEMLDSFNLPKRLWEISPATFSGGEKQRVNLARGFMGKPRLLLLDEPTASLDPVTSERVLTNIERIRDAGTSVVGIFHNPAIVERLADYEVKISPANS